MEISPADNDCNETARIWRHTLVAEAASWECWEERTASSIGFRGSVQRWVWEAFAEYAKKWMNDSFNISTCRSRTWILLDWYVERAHAELTSSYIDIECKRRASTLHTRRISFRRFYFGLELLNSRNFSQSYGGQTYWNATSDAIISTYERRVRLDGISSVFLELFESTGWINAIDWLTRWIFRWF